MSLNLDRDGLGELAAGVHRTEEHIHDRVAVRLASEPDLDDHIDVREAPRRRCVTAEPLLSVATPWDGQPPQARFGIARVDCWEGLSSCDPDLRLRNEAGSPSQTEDHVAGRCARATPTPPRVR